MHCEIHVWLHRVIRGPWFLWIYAYKNYKYSTAYVYIEDLLIILAGTWSNNEYKFHLCKGSSSEIRTWYLDTVIWCTDLWAPHVSRKAKRSNSSFSDCANESLGNNSDPAWRDNKREKMLGLLALPIERAKQTLALVNSIICFYPMM